MRGARGREGGCMLAREFVYAEIGGGSCLLAGGQLRC